MFSAKKERSVTHEGSAMIPARMKIDEFASAHAPLMYFDGVPSFGLNAGTANIMLEALTFAVIDGEVVPRRVTIAHLRANLAGLAHLKAAIEGIELLASQTVNQGRPC